MSPMAYKDPTCRTCFWVAWSQPMRSYALLFVLVAGCSSSVGGDTARDDASPISFTEPPEPKGGDETAAACNGVTVSGTCDDGNAVKCDVATNKLNSRDCRAIGRECVLDVTDGAVCKELTANPCTDPSGSTCSAGVATFCDKTGATDVVRTWECASNDKTCALDECKDGAYCCGETQGCGDIDYEGVCEGNVAKWCSGDELQTWDCDDFDMNCEVDTCAGPGNGALCCDAVDSECERLGFDGECTGSNTLQYCSDDVVETVTCFEDNICEVNEFGEALCVPPPDGDCGDIDYAGICEGTVLKFCGSSSNMLVVIDCADNDDGATECHVDDCIADEAYCCPPA